MAEEGEKKEQETKKVVHTYPLVRVSDNLNYEQILCFQTSIIIQINDNHVSDLSQMCPRVVSPPMLRLGLAEAVPGLAA